MGEYRRTALLVGCNYPNTENELHGCINDVLSIRDILVERFGFDPDRIEVLTDDPDSTVIPTAANIKEALARMIDEAEPGDVLFFHYSGHGTRYPSKHGHHHKQDEALVPSDLNYVTDVDMRALVNRLPEEASFTFLSDSCHSGGLLYKEKEQVGQHETSPEQHEAHSRSYHRHRHHRPKGIPHESVLRQLSSISGIESDNIGAHMVACFGDEASLKFQECDLEHKEIHPDCGILLSGCQANETSADVPEGEGEGEVVEAHGAYTDAVKKVLNEHTGPLTNRELAVKVRAILSEEGSGQHPCLYCSDQNAGSLPLPAGGNFLLDTVCDLNLLHCLSDCLIACMNNIFVSCVRLISSSFLFIPACTYCLLFLSVLNKNAHKLLDVRVICILYMGLLLSTSEFV